MSKKDNVYVYLYLFVYKLNYFFNFVFYNRSIYSNSNDDNTILVLLDTLLMTSHITSGSKTEKTNSEQTFLTQV